MCIKAVYGKEKEKEWKGREQKEREGMNSDWLIALTCSNKKIEFGT